MPRCSHAVSPKGHALIVHNLFWTGVSLSKYHTGGLECQRGVLISLNAIFIFHNVVCFNVVGAKLLEWERRTRRRRHERRRVGQRDFSWSLLLEK